MADISHTSDGSDLGKERILRRLLTNPGEYIWHGQYGAGLASFLGQTSSAQKIASVARGQIFKEASVAKTPSPSVSVAKNTDGGVILTIQYTDQETQTAVLLTAPVGGT
jgi:hypothetical protein